LLETLGGEVLPFTKQKWCAFRSDLLWNAIQTGVRIEARDFIRNIAVPGLVVGVVNFELPARSAF
jgi:hypothetical protein